MRARSQFIAQELDNVFVEASVLLKKPAMFHRAQRDERSPRFSFSPGVNTMGESESHLDNAIGPCEDRPSHFVL
jgi:hypothetical protein